MVTVTDGRSTDVELEELSMTNMSGRLTSVLRLGCFAEDTSVCRSHTLAEAVLHSTRTQRDTVLGKRVPQPSRFGKRHTAPHPMWK